VNGAALLDELASLLRRHVILPAWAPETVALWILHTYAFEWREVSSYLGIESPEKRCGKTTLLAALGEMVRCPVIAANISPSALFRVIDRTGPTLLIDEADTFLHGNDELRGILNSGYSRKTAYVVRSGTTTVGQGQESASDPGDGITQYSTWCPKAVAAIGRLPETLADRCIVIRMQRKTAGESCQPARELDAAMARAQCARFVADHGERLAAARPAIPPSLNDRAGDIWAPLLALADLAGGRWPQLAREAAVNLGASAEENHSIGTLLLEICHAFVIYRVNRIFSRDLVAILNDSESRAWSDLCDGKELDERRLSALLRPYGIKPAPIWVKEFHARGYLLDDFREVFRRYIPRSEFDAFMEKLDRRAAKNRPPKQAAAAQETPRQGPEESRPSDEIEPADEEAGEV
jgi:hypothetical protein